MENLRLGPSSMACNNSILIVEKSSMACNNSMLIVEKAEEEKLQVSARELSPDFSI